MSFNIVLLSVPSKPNISDPNVSSAVEVIPVPTVTVLGFQRVSSVMVVEPDTERGATGLIC